MGVLVNDIILPYAKKNIKIFLVYFILVILSYSIGTLAIPMTITQFINSNMKPNNSFFKNIYKQIQDQTSVGIIYTLSILSLAYSLFTYYKFVVQNNILVDISGHIRVEYIKKIMNKLINSFQEIQESELTYFANNAYWSCRLLISYIFSYVVPFIFTFIIIVIYFSFNLPILNIFLIIQIILLLTFLYFYSDKLVELSNEQEIRYIRCAQNYGDKIKNLLNIIFDNTITTEVKDIKEYQSKQNTAGINLYKLTNYMTLIGTVLNYSLLVFSAIVMYIYFKKNLINKNTITTTLFILVIYISLLDSFVSETVYFGGHNYSKMTRIDDQLRNLKYNTDCKNINGFYSIKFENVYFSYNNKDYILKDLSIEFLPKKINVLMGRSGSGKSTIMQLIIKMYTINSGTIYVDNNDINDICQEDLREQIYYVNQRTILFNYSVIENLKYGNNRSDSYIINLMKKYDLLDYFNTLGNGINTECGVNGSNLSLGMQKIIMVLRGVLKPNKNIIIFDEPLTSLDKKSRIKIVKLIVNETKGKTVIIISHDEEILPYADKVIKL